MKYLICFFVVMISACASQPTTRKTDDGKVVSPSLVSSGLVMRFGTTPEVAFAPREVGVTSGSAGGMMYPGGTPAIFLGAILVHAVTSSAIESSQNKKLADKAAATLGPYKSSIDKVNAELLFPDAAQMAFDGETLYRDVSLKSPFILEIYPLFLLTSDGKTLSLQNQIKIIDAARPKKPIYENVIEVQSEPIIADIPSRHWDADQGLKMRNLSKQLFDESLALAGRDYHKKLQFAEADTSIRYMDGGIEKLERGYLANLKEKTLVFKTLRGWIKSLPCQDRNSCL